MSHNRLLLLFASLGAGALLVPSSAAAQSSQTNYVPAGTAWGSFVGVGDSVVSGRSAYSAFGCGGEGDTNRTDSVRAGSTARAGEVTTETEAIRLGSDPAARSTTNIENVDLLAGRVTAKAVRAVSTTRRGQSRFAHTGAGSRFVGLRVDGRAVNNGATNRRVTLPGVGYVVLNGQREQEDGAGHITRMIEVRVLRSVPSLGARAGTTIVVGHAQSAFRRTAGPLGGTAFGSSAVGSSGRALRDGSGPSARLFMPCVGTEGERRTNQVARAGVPGVFELANVQSTSRGRVSGRSAKGRLSNTLAQATVLRGLVNAGAVRAVASGERSEGTYRFSTAGSRFGQLSVRGLPGIDADVRPNTRRRLPGLGTLWLRRVVRSAHSIEVRMIELHVTEQNDHDLPVGAVIRVGVARSSIR